jgi:uncharacterized protein (DUF305 family)
MRNSFALVLVDIALAGAACIAGCRSKSTVEAVREPVLSEADKTFVIQAENAGAQQRALGGFINEQSKNKQIKQYADLLVKHGSESLEKLDEIKRKYGLSDTEQPPIVAGEFKGLSKRAFDQQFVKRILQDQQKAITLFQQQAQSAQENDVRQYASGLLPTLQSDFKEAQDLQMKFLTPAKKSIAAASKRKVAHSQSF